MAAASQSFSGPAMKGGIKGKLSQWAVYLVVHFAPDGGPMYVSTLIYGQLLTVDLDDQGLGKNDIGRHLTVISGEEI